MRVGIASNIPAFVDSLAGLEGRMATLAMKFSELVSLERIGTSADSQHGIYGLVVGRAAHDGAATPVALHTGGVHGREVPVPNMLMQWAERRLGEYGSDPHTTHLLDRNRFAFVVVANPTGYHHTTSTGEWMRVNATGTDLNRNMSPSQWVPGAGDPHHSHGPTGHHGSAPLSEPESAALARWAAKLDPSIAIDWHSWMPGNLSATIDATGLGRRFGALAYEFNGYAPQSSADLYPAPGTVLDLMTHEHGVPALTVETGRTLMQGREFDRVIRGNHPLIDFTGHAARDPRATFTAPVLHDIAYDVRTGALTALGTPPFGICEQATTRPLEVLLRPDAREATRLIVPTAEETAAWFEGALPRHALEDARHGFWIAAQNPDGARGPLRHVRPQADGSVLVR